MKLLVCILCLFVLTGYTVEEKVGEETLCSYTVKDLVDVQEAEGRDVVVDGESFSNDDWKDFTKKMNKFDKAVLLTIFKELNRARVADGLLAASNAQIKQAIINKYDEL